MPVENIRDSIIIGLDSQPPVQAEAPFAGGKIRYFVATVAVAAADDDTSVIRICRVHSSWTLVSAKVFNTAITGGTDYTLGIHQTAANGGAVVVKNTYADGVSLATANTTGLEIAFNTRAITAAKNRIWQDLALTSDPNRYYDLTMTADTIGTAAGNITVQVLVAVE